MTKDEIRAIYQEKRMNLSDDEVRMLSHAVQIQVIKELSFWGLEYIHIFLPITIKKELETEALIQKIRMMGINTVLPRTNFKDGSMEHVIYEDDTVMGMNKYGLREPVGGRTVPSEEIDLVFVPLLAYDSHGYRVGYGKGFYDRFLIQTRMDVKKIGLSLFEPTEHLIDDIHEGDIAIDSCITPSGVIRFR